MTPHLAHVLRLTGITAMAIACLASCVLLAVWGLSTFRYDRSIRR